MIDCTALRYRILGPLQIRTGARWTGVDAPKLRALLGILLTNANELMPATRLRDELWEDGPPISGLKPLQLYVGRLRRILDDPAGGQLVTRPTGYVLRVGPGELDSQVFSDAAASAWLLSDQGDAVAALDQLDAALALWHGATLADVPPTPSMQSAIVRLAALRLSALESRFAAQLARGRHRQVVADLEAAVAENPLHEALCEHLMVALDQSGRRADALAAYEGIERRLAGELAVPPGAALRQLVRAIRAGDGDRRAAPSRRPGAPP